MGKIAITATSRRARARFAPGAGRVSQWRRRQDGPEDGRGAVEHRFDKTENPPPGSSPIPALEKAWEGMGGVRRLGEFFKIHRGIQWTPPQACARSEKARPGYRPGLWSSRGAAQFLRSRSVVYLDARADRIRGAAIDLPWDKPKIVLSGWSGRDRPWRLAAAQDREGVLLSRQFIALWPRKPLSDAEFMAFVAVLNGPVANAYVAARNGDGNIRIGNLDPIPIPRGDLPPAGELAADYAARLAAPDAPDRDDRMEKLLIGIDARVLGAYDLPPQLERRLLERFRGAARPVAHRWRHWDDSCPMPGLTLAERMLESGRAHPRGPWVRDVFRPLPENEAELWRDYGV